MPVSTVSDLVVWQRAMDLTQTIYTLVAEFPPHERFGLVSQLRRAAVSIPSNIAEGWGYGRTGRYVHHLRVARGSGVEVMTQIALAQRLGFVSRLQVSPVIAQVDEVRRMLTALILALERRNGSEGVGNRK